MKPTSHMKGWRSRCHVNICGMNVVGVGWNLHNSHTFTWLDTCFAALPSPDHGKLCVFVISSVKLASWLKSPFFVLCSFFKTLKLSSSFLCPVDSLFILQHSKWKIFWVVTPPRTRMCCTQFTPFSRVEHTNTTPNVYLFPAVFHGPTL